MTASQNYNNYDTATATAPKEYLFKVLVIGEFGVGRSTSIRYLIMPVDFLKKSQCKIQIFGLQTDHLLNFIGIVNNAKVRQLRLTSYFLVEGNVFNFLITIVIK